MKNRTKTIKIVIWCSVFMSLVLCFSIVSGEIFEMKSKNRAPFFTMFQRSTHDSLQREITITAVGDVMMGSAYPSTHYLPPHDGNRSFSHVTTYLKGDVVFGNLEGVLLDTGKSFKCKDTSKACYAFRMPERYVYHLKNAGFTVMSMANNHVNDFKRIGILTTQRLLRANEIAYAGTLGKPYTIFKIKEGNIRIGFCAFAPNANTMNLNNRKLLQELIQKLKSQCDIIIVSFHGGAEGGNHQHVPKQMELFYNEKRGDVYAFAHSAIDAGADVVLGHGPHVPRAVELYKQKFIVYSMGNFCTYGQFSLSHAAALAPIYQIKIQPNGDFIQARVISGFQTHKGLVIDTLERAFQKIKQLTTQDFPEGKLRFEEGGMILMN